jgi:hypothetical protein
VRFDAGASGTPDASILFDGGFADSGTVSPDAGAGGQDAGGATDGGRVDGGGPLDDAGASFDAGASLDAGQALDAGPTTMDAGPPFQVDAGDPGETLSPDAGLTRRTALELAVGCSHSSPGVDPLALLLLGLAWRASRARR